MMSLNFSDFTILVFRYMLTWSAINFFNSSTARFFSFILATSCKKVGSKIENSSFTSENRLITPSLLILCLSNSFILAFISSNDIFFPSPELVSLNTNTRTDSKKAASIRSCSSTKDEHKDNAWWSNRASWTNEFLSSIRSLSIMKLTAPLIVFDLSKSVPVWNLE